MTLPKRTSKNPTIGVIRCGCGDVATVHNYRGQRSKYRYSICETCGCNMSVKEAYQEKLNNHFYSVEDLEQTETETENHHTPQPEPEPEPEEIDLIKITCITAAAFSLLGFLRSVL